MNLEVFADADSVATGGCGDDRREARAAVAARGRFVLAVSGGHTPWHMLRALAGEDIPWAGCACRLRSTSVWPPTGTRTGTSRTCAKACLSMPRCAPSRSMPCRWNAPTWRPQPRSTPDSPGDRRIAAGARPRPPGSRSRRPHCFPGAWRSGTRYHRPDVALTGVYQGRRRMTLTYPMLNRARRVLWVVTGSEKVEMLAPARRRSYRFPPGGCARTGPVLADRAAAGQLTAIIQARRITCA